MLDVSHQLTRRTGALFVRLDWVMGLRKFPCKCNIVQVAGYGGVLREDREGKAGGADGVIKYNFLHKQFD